MRSVPNSHWVLLLLVVPFSPFPRPFTFMQPLCFCVLELMPGAVPWMPCCLWWECFTSRRPHSCSQTQLITKGHHIRDRGFQLSQYNKVVTVYVRACAFTIRPALFHSWKKSKIGLVNFLKKILFTEESSNGFYVYLRKPYNEHILTRLRVSNHTGSFVKLWA